MDFKTIEIKVDRKQDGSVNVESELTKEVVKKYVLPIIQNNEGWGTKEVTVDNFFTFPKQKIQDILDPTVGFTSFAKCYIALIDNLPAGLIQGDFFSPEDQKNSGHPYMSFLREIFSSPDFYLWKKMIDDKEIEGSFLQKNFLIAKEILALKDIIFSPGIVVRADLQGKKTGLSDYLYQYMEGIGVAWTSNPVVVAKHRKLFKRTTFYPLLGETISSVEDIAMAGCIMADLLNWSEDTWKTMPFGSAHSIYFVQERGQEYLIKAQEKVSKGELTQTDLKRFEWILSQTGVHGALVSMN